MQYYVFFNIITDILFVFLKSCMTILNILITKNYLLVSVTTHVYNPPPPTGLCGSRMLSNIYVLCIYVQKMKINERKSRKLRTPNNDRSYAPKSSYVQVVCDCDGSRKNFIYSKSYSINLQGKIFVHIPALGLGQSLKWNFSFQNLIFPLHEV